jgi:hypothetical protein
MGDDDFLAASRADFERMLSDLDGLVPVAPAYRAAVADALAGLQTHALVVRDALGAVAP